MQTNESDSVVTIAGFTNLTEKSSYLH